MSSPWPMGGESIAALSALSAPAKRHFHWEDDLFVHGNEERERGSKTFKYSAEGGVADAGAGGVCFDDDATQDEACEFVCGVEGCPVVLHSLAAYDAHYQHWHTFRCEVCGLQLPNNRLLGMHLAERHDELFRCMAKTRKMYQCLVEGCSQKSNTRKGRQLHLVAKHSYPPNYTYDRRIRRTPTKSTRARHKEKPQRIDTEMSDSTFTTIGASRSPEALSQLAGTGACASASASLAGAAPAIATPAPALRPAVVSRSTILSFMPRSVRSAGAAAATAGVAGAAKSATPAQPLPSYDSKLAATPAAREPAPLPTPADPTRTGSLFTSMRDRRDSDHDHGMHDDDDGDVEVEAGVAKDDGDEDDEQERKEGAADGSGMDDVEAAVGVSRLHVSQSLPKKCSFGSMNRRHK